MLMVSTSYPRSAQDWRGRFIYDMARHVATLDGVRLSLWAPPGELPAAVSPAATVRESGWLQGMSSKGGIAQILRRRPLVGLLTGLRLIRHQWRVYRRARADVVHVNWMQNALALGRSETPALITVLGSDLRLLRLPGVRSAMRAVLRARRVILAPNAEWMVAALQQQFGDVARIVPVPFGVAGDWFEVTRGPRGPDVAEWLVVSRVTRDKLGDLPAWGEGLFGANRRLHLFGPMQDPLPLPDWVHYHGPTHATELRTTWFPRATGLITLSRHDEGRPQVMLEAMASGVPVVASDLAAHRDFVRQGETGYVVGSRGEFVAALHRLERSDENARIGRAARTWVRGSIGTWDDCARRYLSLYRQLVEIAT